MRAHRHGLFDRVSIASVFISFKSSSKGIQSSCICARIIFFVLSPSWAFLRLHSVPFLFSVPAVQLRMILKGAPSNCKVAKKAPKLAATRHLIIRSCLSDLVSNLLQTVPPHPTPPFVRPTTQYSKHFDQKTKIYSEAFS